MTDTISRLTDITIDDMRLSDIPAVASLVIGSFNDSVAETFTDEGIKNFSQGIAPDSLQQRWQQGSLFLLAKTPNTDQPPIAMLELRTPNSNTHLLTHINLFFVDTQYQQQGIGRVLFTNLLERVHTGEKPFTDTIDHLSVNASLNSVEAYQHLGFYTVGDEAVIKGIRYQAMQYAFD